MGQAWRSGADTTVERVVVGRRTAEQELDLIGLIEAEAPEAERARPLPPSPLAVPAPVGEPTNREMVQAVRDWIESAIKPKAEGHAKFEAVVAMNALGIVMRDLDAGVRAEDRALAARSEEHTSELQSLMRISYAVFCLKKKTKVSEQQYTQ